MSHSTMKKGHTSKPVLVKVYLAVFVCLVPRPRRSLTSMDPVSEPCLTFLATVVCGVPPAAAMPAEVEDSPDTCNLVTSSS